MTKQPLTPPMPLNESNIQKVFDTWAAANPDLAERGIGIRPSLRILSWDDYFRARFASMAEGETHTFFACDINEVTAGASIEAVMRYFLELTPAGEKAWTVAYDTHRNQYKVTRRIAIAGAKP